MNKVILMGRLTKDPETRYSQAAEPIAVTRFSIAVDRRFKRDNEPDADFFNCTAFRKTGEFVGKYFKKGLMVAVSGSLQNRSWEDQQTGQKRFATDVIAEDVYFGESKASFEARNAGAQPAAPDNNSSQGGDAQNNPGFFSIDQNIDDDDLPF